MNYEFQIKKRSNSGFTRTPKIGVTPKGGGFTIIETMIAVSLFLVVAVSGMGALLNASFIHQRSEGVSSVLDNLSFMMDDMSRNLRTGYNYHCIDDGNILTTTPHSCASGAGVSFKIASGEAQWIYYRGNTSAGGVGIFKSSDGGLTSVQLTPDEVSIDPNVSGFSVLGGEASTTGDKQQPLVTIQLVGKITIKGVTTPFSLQTSVSQRQLDI